MKDLLLGAHFSIAGGLHKAFDHADRYGCTTIQIFTQNSSTWKVRELDENEIEKFRIRRRESGVKEVIAHAGYLINLAGPDTEKRMKSIESLKGEIKRAGLLGIDKLVLHPGSHVKTSVEEGTKRIAHAVNRVFSMDLPDNVKILFETTAGQGDCIGHRLEHIKEIIKLIENKERTGVCVDTCHIFASGYSIEDKKGYEEFISEADSLFGINKIECFHLNDSKKPLGSRVDRHAHIGKGCIGDKAFEFIMNDSRFSHVPKIIETPDFEDKKDMNAINFKRLVSMLE